MFTLDFPNQQYPVSFDIGFSRTGFILHDMIEIVLTLLSQLALVMKY